jgi:hypothetical protein
MVTLSSTAFGLIFGVVGVVSVLLGVAVTWGMLRKSVLQLEATVEKLGADVVKLQRVVDVLADRSEREPTARLRAVAADD